MYYIHLLSLGNKEKIKKKISTLKTVEETWINEECAQKTDTSELGNNSGRRQERKDEKAGGGGEAEVWRWWPCCETLLSVDTPSFIHRYFHNFCAESTLTLSYLGHYWKSVINM